MWDSVVYESEADANSKAEEHSSHGFETYISNEDGSYFVYTRRLSNEESSA